MSHLQQSTSLEGIESLAIVGATGLVGREFVSLLSERRIRIPTIRLLASARSEGESLDLLEEESHVEPLTEASFNGIEVAFFSVPAEVTRRYVPTALEAGCLVIDDSSCFRMDEPVPLVVPEVNGSELREFGGSLIAIPNCTVTPLALLLAPLRSKFGLKRVVVTTLQSVSGAGREAFEELSKQAVGLLGGSQQEPNVFPHPIAFNCLPQIGEASQGSSCDEEQKIQREVRKILNEPELPVVATTIRVPTFCGHGLSINVELERLDATIEGVREMLDISPGIKVLDRPECHIYPTNLEATGSDSVFVGRIRRDESVKAGLSMWAMVDNLRKGAALNALQCLETLYNYRRMS